MKNIFGLIPLSLAILVCLGWAIANPPTYKLIVFEGSDWCVNCKKIEKDILNDNTFNAYLTEKNISVERIDFPQRKKLSKQQKEYNEQIADKYAFDGTFPSLLIVRTDPFLFHKIHYHNDSVKKLMTKIEEQIQEME